MAIKYLKKVEQTSWCLFLTKTPFCSVCYFFLAKILITNKIAIMIQDRRSVWSNQKFQKGVPFAPIHAQRFLEWFCAIQA